MCCNTIIPYSKYLSKTFARLYYITFLNSTNCSLRAVSHTYEGIERKTTSSPRKMPLDDVLEQLALGQIARVAEAFGIGKAGGEVGRHHGFILAMRCWRPRC